MKLGLAEPEYPVDGLCAVDDLEPLVAGEERVPVGQDVEVLATHERYLKE